MYFLATAALTGVTAIFCGLQYLVHQHELFCHRFDHTERREAEAQRGVVVQGKFPKSVHIGGK